MKGKSLLPPGFGPRTAQPVESLKELRSVSQKLRFPGTGAVLGEKSVSVAIVAMGKRVLSRMQGACAVFSYVASPAVGLPHFSTYLIHGTTLKKNIEHRMCVLVFLYNCCPNDWSI